MKGRNIQMTPTIGSAVIAMALGISTAQAGIFGALDDLGRAAQDSGVTVPSQVYEAGDAAQDLREAGQQAMPSSDTGSQPATCPPGYTCTPQTPPPACPPGDICRPATQTAATPTAVPPTPVSAPSSSLSCPNILHAPGYKTDYHWLQTHPGQDTLSVQLVSATSNHEAGCFVARIYSDKQPAPRKLRFGYSMQGVNQAAADVGAMSQLFAYQSVWFADPIGYAMPGSHQRNGPQIPANHHYLPTGANGNRTIDILMGIGCKPALAAFNLQTATNALCWIDHPASATSQQ